jgi:excinuclease ABC subunit C
MKLSILQKAKLPDTPGVYFFHAGKKILYIGKATSLKDRVRSYFSKDLVRTRGFLLVQMLEKATKISFQQTDSVLEALILETQLIKKHQPPYNTIEKDDKSYNYVAITKEDYPRVLIVRGKDLPIQFPPEERMYLIGPFPQGGVLKDAMKIIRRIFPYRDTCTPNSGKPCFNAQIGLCSGVCAGSISKTDYRNLVKKLILFFEGKKKKIITEFTKEMNSLVKTEDFESANIIKKRIFALNHIQDISLLKRSTSTSNSVRIEAYDIAHLSGQEMVGVMTVIENGLPNKTEYRKFKIKTLKGSNDPGALKEVLTRRLKHTEWTLPKIIAVDGNEIQKKVAEKALEDAGIKNIDVVSVVKDEHHRARDVLGDKKIVGEHKIAIILANAEAHRFSITYHKLLRKKAFLK